MEVVPLEPVIVDDVVDGQVVTDTLGMAMS
jgi:hypothetical protein